MKCLCSLKRVSSAVNYSAVKVKVEGKVKARLDTKRAVSFFHAIFK